MFFSFIFSLIKSLTLIAMLLLFALEISTQALFRPSIYDFLVNPEERKLENYSGFLKEHKYNTDLDTFGEFSIMTLNAHIESDINEKDQINGILNLINTHHQTIFSLQGLSLTALASLKESISPHYDLICEKSIFKETRLFKSEILPIIFDAKSVIKIRDFLFHPKDFDNQVWGCMGVFYNKLTKNLFSVVNLDLISGDKVLVDAQFYNVLKFIYESQFSENPFFITGTINIILSLIHI